MSSFKKPSEENQPPSEEAIKEDNMMWYGMIRRPTSEDCDKALQMVEELILITQQDPTGERMLNKLDELAQNAPEILMLIGSHIPGSVTTAFIIMKRRKNMEELSDQELYIAAIKKGFASAIEELRGLKEGRGELGGS